MLRKAQRQIDGWIGIFPPSSIFIHYPSSTFHILQDDTSGATEKSPLKNEATGGEAPPSYESVFPNSNQA